MKKRCLNLNKKFLLMFLLIVFGIFGAFLTIKYVKASDKPFNYGYFYNVYFTNNPETGPPVIAGGIPSSVNSKSSFISFIKGLYNGSGNNHVGAAYIIQTMRGSPWDHDPSISGDDMKDWENKINNPNITVGWNDVYTRANLNSTITPGSPTDVVEYDAGRTNGNSDSIVFYSNSTPLYALKRPCGNPVGHLSGLTAPIPNPTPGLDTCDPIEIAVESRSAYPAVPASSANPSSYPAVAPVVIPVRVSTPHQYIGTYSLKTLFGSDGSITALNTTGGAETVTYTEIRNHITSYTDLYRNGDPIYRNGDPIYDVNGKLIGYEQIFTGKYKQILVGYVQIYTGTRINYAGPVIWYSSIGPCYDYKLIASVDTAYAAVEAGAPISVGSSISSAPSGRTNPVYNTHTKSRDTQWQLVKVVVEPNATFPTWTNSTSAPCQSLSSYESCSTIAIGSTIVPTIGSSFPPVSQTIGDEKAGTKVCFALGVQPRAAWYYSGVDPQWNYSAFNLAGSCVIIVKKPKVQIWGGDLSTGGLVQTSTSVKDIAGLHTFGSWVEYGIFAAGSITGAASGSAFAGLGLATYPSTVACNYSTLSFTNTDAGSSACTANATIGKYITTQSIPDVIASFSSGTAIAAGTTIIPSNYPSGTYTVNGNLILGASTLASGTSIIIKATGTVTINGDQKYSNGPYTNISLLPQLVIIANKIVIRNSVSGDNNPATNKITQVDAWLVATNSSKNGSIATCEVEGKTINDCNNMLTVNGPVMTDKLYLYRTAGSGTVAASGDPAEIFNLRADVYLWSIARATSSGHVQTVYTTELPPRF